MPEMPLPPPAPPRRRPATIDEFKQLMEQGGPPFQIPSFQPRPSDIIVATFPKCGTTWTQQIVHGLRTRGSMDFDEISMVVPFMEVAHLFGIDLDGPQVAEPRAFKTHLPWDQVPKGGRYIYVMRDPYDAILSAYHFLAGWLFDAAGIDVEAFYFEFEQGRSTFGTYGHHVRSWWEQRRRDDVLYLCFEDMKVDLEGAVRRIAAFMGLAGDEERIAVATRQSTFEFMRAHVRQFDEHPMTDVMKRISGLPEDSGTTKVRAGRVGDGQSLPPRVRAAIDEEWKREIEGPLGVRSYAELRALLSSGA